MDDVLLTLGWTKHSYQNGFIHGFVATFSGMHMGKVRIEVGLKGNINVHGTYKTRRGSPNDNISLPNSCTIYI